jgi:hypothetical protein
MNQVRILAANGCVGSGFSDEAFEAGLRLEPHAICADGGSDDLGPEYLGTADPFHFGKAAVEHDLERMVISAARAEIPCLVSSAGIAGTDHGVDAFADIVTSVSKEHGLNLRIARVYCEVDPGQVLGWLRDNRIEALVPWAPALTEEQVASCTRIVGVMGSAPYLQALRDGAKVVIGGRSSDPSTFAAAAEFHGIPPANGWHLGKLLECGGFCTEGPAFESVLGIAAEDFFEIRALSPGATASPLSVATHMFYETASPNLLPEPPGTLDVSQATYTQVDPRTVRVRGARFATTAPSTKLEGVRQVGYRSVMMGVVGDPEIIALLPKIFEAQSDRVLSRVPTSKPTEDLATRRVAFHTFGRAGLWSKWTERFGAAPPFVAGRGEAQEVAVVADVVAPSEDEARALATHLRHGLLHGTKDFGLARDGNVAFPFIEFRAGAVYEWVLFHRVLGDVSEEVSRIEHATS